MTKKVEKQEFQFWQPQSWPPPIKEMPRFEPINIPPPLENLPKDLTDLQQVAKDMGAVDVKIISGKDILPDIRSKYVMCHLPRCRWLNSNAHCPQKVDIPFDEATEVVCRYDSVIAYKVLPPTPEEMIDVGPIKLDAYYTMGGAQAPEPRELARDIVRLRKLASIGRKLEQLAYYRGYPFSFTVSTGPCIAAWCADTGRCPGMEKGGFCKFVNTQPVGTGALYIDYHALARKLAWGELQPGGNCAFLGEVPEGFEYYNIGLVLLT